MLTSKLSLLVTHHYQHDLYLINITRDRESDNVMLRREPCSFCKVRTMLSIYARFIPSRS